MNFPQNSKLVNGGKIFLLPVPEKTCHLYNFVVSRATGNMPFSYAHTITFLRNYVIIHM